MESRGRAMEGLRGPGNVKRRLWGPRIEGLRSKGSTGQGVEHSRARSIEVPRTHTSGRIPTLPTCTSLH
eukprot:9465577-Pyramimonas_sp.AAC.1